VYDPGELFHVRGRSSALHLAALDEAQRSRDARERAREVQEPAARLIAEAKRRRQSAGQEASRSGASEPLGR
jgi:hypothetical protein